MFFAQLKNEVWKLFGKKRTYIGFGVFMVAQFGMLWLFRNNHDGISRLLSNNGYVPDEFISALTGTMIILGPQLVLMLPLYISLVGGDLVAKEYEDGTLRMILSRPIARWRLLFVKWVAGVVFCIVQVAFLGVIALLFARILFPWRSMFVLLPQGGFGVLSASDGFAYYVFAHVFIAFNSSVMLSIAFMFSCFNMKPAAATILTLSYLLLCFVLQHIPFFDNYRNWFITYQFESWIRLFQSPIQWSDIIQAQCILVAICTTVLIIGATAFQVRDIKS